jgi:hypothetical protein
MFASWLDQLSGHGTSALIGLLVGAVVTWLLASWKRLEERRSILSGDARNTIVIAHHLVEQAEAPSPAGTASRKLPARLRIRSLGQGQLDRVVPNGHLARVLLRRARAVTPQTPLISMEDAEGSYLLETLTNFVCDRIANAPFEHDLYVMAPCCEPAGLAEYQPITILVIAIRDLELFLEWPLCRGVQVEHGMDGARVLTLMELARRFKAEQAKLAQLRQAGKRTRYVETMYVLDLGLDKRSAAVPTKPVSWGSFEAVLKAMNLE